MQGLAANAEGAQERQASDSLSGRGAEAPRSIARFARTTQKKRGFRGETEAALRYGVGVKVGQEMALLSFVTYSPRVLLPFT